MYMYNRDLKEKFNYKEWRYMLIFYLFIFIFNSMFMLLYNNFYKIFNFKKSNLLLI